MFATLYPKLRQHENKYFNSFRMSIKLFDDLLLLIEEDLSPRNNCSVFARKLDAIKAFLVSRLARITRETRASREFKKVPRMFSHSRSEC
jgi:hypothetical protein